MVSVPKSSLAHRLSEMSTPELLPGQIRRYHEMLLQTPLGQVKPQSEKNPGRLFLKCPKRWYNFFQESQGKAKVYMEGCRIQEGYPQPQ